MPGRRSFHVRGCDRLGWEGCVSAADGLPEDGRIYTVGEGPRPLVRLGGRVVPLGLPAPTRAPSVFASENFGEDCDARSYVFTYTRGPEESAPSPPSRQATVRDGQSVSVAVGPVAGAEWGVDGFNVYRSTTGTRSEEELAGGVMSEYLLVGRLDVSETVLSDATPTRNLAFPLATVDRRPPPAGLRRIARLNSTGQLVGTSGNTVHFAANFDPGNWPPDLDLILPSNIVNMCAVDTNVFVTTDGRPFIIDASNYCDPAARKPVADIDVALPDVGRGHRGFAATPFGMVYPSVPGLVLLKADGTFEIISAGWLTADQWRSMQPETARLAYWNGRVFCVTDEAAFVFNIDSKNYGDSDKGTLTTISDRPDDLMVSESGELFMLEDGRLWRWDAGETFRPYEWVSSELRGDSDYTPTVLSVETDGIVAQVVPGGPPVFLAGPKPVRLPRVGALRGYRVRLTGTGTVECVKLASAVMTMEAGV
jgi:hypothetical protein